MEKYDLSVKSSTYFQEKKGSLSKDFKQYSAYKTLAMTVGALPIWSKTFSYAIRSLCLLHIIHTYAYEFTETRGESMLPTLSATNDYVHVLKHFQNGKGIKMGDCVVAVKAHRP